MVGRLIGIHIFLARGVCKERLVSFARAAPQLGRVEQNMQVGLTTSCFHGTFCNAFVVGCWGDDSMWMKWLRRFQKTMRLTC